MRAANAATTSGFRAKLAEVEAVAGEAEIPWALFIRAAPNSECAADEGLDSATWDGMRDKQ